MTSRQARTERRAAERKEKKLQSKSLPLDSTAPPAASIHIGFASQNGAASAPSPALGFVSQSTTRADTNRQNARFSTGPRTLEGKLASSRNAVKHGLASCQLIIPGEDPAQYQALLNDLLHEHQPASAAEDLLVVEMAQSFWLTQRAIRLQNDCFSPDGQVDAARLSLFMRYQTTHQRAFHKALALLLQLKKQAAQAIRGFVSQTRSREPVGFVSQSTLPLETGFVSPPPLRQAA